MMYNFNTMGRVCRSATLLTVLLLPTIGAGYCALVHDSCTEGNMATVAIDIADCCLSCFDAAIKEGIIKSPVTIYAPDHHGVQAWLPITVKLNISLRPSTFACEIGWDASPPPNPLPVSVLRI